MCRNIRKLRKPEGLPIENELDDAALQFVRKISGYREPSNANREAFERAVKDVSKASRKLFESLTSHKERAQHNPKTKKRTLDEEGMVSE